MKKYKTSRKKKAEEGNSARLWISLFQEAREAKPSPPD